MRIYKRCIAFVGMMMSFILSKPAEAYEEPGPDLAVAVTHTRLEDPLCPACAIGAKVTRTSPSHVLVDLVADFVYSGGVRFEVVLQDGTIEPASECFDVVLDGQESFELTDQSSDLYSGFAWSEVRLIVARLGSC